MKAGVIVAALALSYVLGQWLLLRPRPEERRCMRLRAQARRQGWQVRLRKPPSWWPDAPPLVPRYTWPCPEWHGVRRCFLWRAEEGWRALPTGAVPMVLQSCALSGLAAVESEAQAWHFYWDERADLAGIAILRALADELMVQPIDRSS